MDEDETDEGWSWAAIEGIVLDTTEWTWGTVQGAFNEKATLSQIIVDAVIGMIPVVGDVTAVRDIIAVIIGMCNDPKKREDKFQWMLLVVLIVALIPVIGGVVKGVGRLVLKAVGELAQVSNVSLRTTMLLAQAQEISAVLHHLGFGNAEEWIKAFRFANLQNDIIYRLNDLIVRIRKGLQTAQEKMGTLMPEKLETAVDAFFRGLAKIQASAAEHIPDAIKELDKQLREIQEFIYSGGETTTRATAHTVEAGEESVQLANQARIIEGEGAGALRTRRGGFEQNTGTPATVETVYRPEDGYPNLLSYSKGEGAKKIYPQIQTFAGKIVNREIRKGEQIFRVFGEGGTTHGYNIGSSFAAGSPTRPQTFWGLNDVPTDGKTWRLDSAVLDEWNRNGYILVGTVLRDGDNLLKACTGLIAEQRGAEILGQYLPGGGKQAMLALDKAMTQQLNDLGNLAISTKSPHSQVIGDISWEVRPTGWMDVNGIHGYAKQPSEGAVQTSPLGLHERASKTDQDPLSEQP